MKHFSTLLLAIIITIGFSVDSLAADGDTTTIVAHQDVHWNWNGNFFDTVSFPTTGTYQKVIMHYVLGCPSIGCSGWDYTTKIQVWDENNTTDRYELAKVITPYAGDKTQNWHHEYKFDVTHMMPVLQGEKVINARYDGWQDGFTISVYFEFIEGTPPRTPLQVDQVYYGGFKYGDASDPINVNLKKDTITQNSATTDVEFIMSSTGHGFGDNNGNGVNPENCAEFCDKYYKVLINGTSRVQQTVWRDDCGSEPLYAQTGTWVYNRAGWCPGSESQVFNHDISPFVSSGNDFTIKVDWEDYTATNVNMSYNISGQVIQYGPANFTLDAEIMDVLNPTDYDRYSRHNPSGLQPKFVIRNTGSSVIYSAKIKYGVAGGTYYTTKWTGRLEFLQTEEVTLPIPDHNFYKGDGSNNFTVEILEVNNATDMVASNNKYTTHFETINQHNGPFNLTVKSNNRGFDNWYILKNSMGDTIVLNQNLANNTEYIDSLNLDDGVYTFYIEDADGDGLSWWANTSQGSGSMSFKNVGVPNRKPPTFFETMEPDFGNFFVYNFSVGYPLTVGKFDYDEGAWTPPATVGIQTLSATETTGSFKVYPNPTVDFVTVESVEYHDKAFIKVYNQSGALIYQNHTMLSTGKVESINVKNWSNGIYFISVEDDSKRETIKFVKQ